MREANLAITSIRIVRGFHKDSRLNCEQNITEALWQKTRRSLHGR